MGRHQLPHRSSLHVRDTSRAVPVPLATLAPGAARCTCTHPAPNAGLPNMWVAYYDQPGMAPVAPVAGRPAECSACYMFFQSCQLLRNTTDALPSFCYAQLSSLQRTSGSWQVAAWHGMAWHDSRLPQES
jgi:hypothetical protein